MKKVLGCLRKADTDWGMIQDGDRIAVGVSGGKDSILLLHSLSLYRLFSKRDYHLEAVTVSMGIANESDYSPVTELCTKMGIRHTVVPSSIGRIVFDVRNEKNPCALCANLRRGILNNAALELQCSKVALAHNMDDVLETFFMSLLYESRLNTFSPKTFLDRKRITVIRPFVYLPEKHILNVVAKEGLPVIKSACPAAGHTIRQKTKELISSLAAEYPNSKKKMLAALQNCDQYHLWDKHTFTDPEDG